MAFVGIFLMWFVALVVILIISACVCVTCFIASNIIMYIKQQKTSGIKIKPPWYVQTLRIVGGIAAVPLVFCILTIAYALITDAIDKETNLARAAEQYDYVQVEKILNGGADVDERDQEGKTLLMCIVAQDEYVTEKDGRNYHFGSKRTEDEEGADEKDLKLMKLLIQYGADINAKKEDCGDHTLHMAGDDGYNSIYANSDHDCGNTPLLYAVRYRSPRIVSFLIKNGAEVNSPNTSGFTPLLMCLDNRSDDNGGDELVKILLDSGADTNAITNFNQTAQWLLERNKDKRHEKMEEVHKKTTGYLAQ